MRWLCACVLVLCACSDDPEGALPVEEERAALCERPDHANEHAYLKPEGKPKRATPEQVKRIEKELREQREQIEAHAKSVDMRALIETIAHTQPGPARHELIDEYMVAAHVQQDGEGEAEAVDELTHVLESAEDLAE